MSGPIAILILCEQVGGGPFTATATARHSQLLARRNTNGVYTVVLRAVRIYIWHEHEHEHGMNFMDTDKVDDEPR